MCDHQDHEDCMVCHSCGQCREDLHEDDVCAECGKADAGIAVVLVTVQGGVVQDVGCPPGVKVLVRDYDVDGQEEGLQEDEEGNKCAEAVWE